MSFKYWLRSKYRKLKGICIMCGKEPINSKEDGPFRSDNLGRYCKKISMFASNYGMSKQQMMRVI